MNGHIAESAGAERRESGPGRYRGYSLPRYDEVVRTSLYVPAADGTRLALDVYRPAREGQVEQQPLPVVFQFTPYNRSTVLPGGGVAPYPSFPLALANFGYVLAIADVRGKGASFGSRRGPADERELSDAADLIGWLGTQDWSSGRVGVNGCSYNGSTALQAARAPSEFVRAAFVGSSMFDQYEAFAPGGIPNKGLADDLFSADLVTPVDEDVDETLKSRALREHDQNTKTGEFFAASPFRDDPNPHTGSDWWIDASLYPHLSNIRRDIAFYLYAGYFDSYGTQTVLQFLNLPNPKKLAFGAWSHCEHPHFRLDMEQLRFFDYWLKDIPNGIMDEPPVLVEMKGAPGGTEWRALKSWPTDAARTCYYLSAAPAQSERRAGPAPWFDGGLAAAPTPRADAPISLADAPDVPPIIRYGFPVTGVDASSAVFTLEPEEHPREVLGRPAATIWISCAELDADIRVYLEVVHRGGAEVVATGVLRASHRTVGQPPYLTGGVPWATHRRADALPLDVDVPVPLRISLSATAFVLEPGDMVRLAVTTRDPRSVDAAVPAVLLYADAEHPSSIELPEVDTRSCTLGPELTPGRILTARPLGRLSGGVG